MTKFSKIDIYQHKDGKQKKSFCKNENKIKKLQGYKTKQIQGRQQKLLCIQKDEKT